jgi:hypothetical protein
LATKSRDGVPFVLTIDASAQGTNEDVVLEAKQACRDLKVRPKIERHLYVRADSGLAPAKDCDATDERCICDQKLRTCKEFKNAI